MRGKSARQSTEQDASSRSSGLLRQCVAIVTVSTTDCKRKHERLNQIPTSQLRLRRVHPFFLNVIHGMILQLFNCIPSMIPPGIRRLAGYCSAAQPYSVKKKRGFPFYMEAFLAQGQGT